MIADATTALDVAAAGDRATGAHNAAGLQAALSPCPMHWLSTARRRSDMITRARRRWPNIQRTPMGGGDVGRRERVFLLGRAHYSAAIQAVGGTFAPLASLQAVCADTVVAGSLRAFFCARPTFVLRLRSSRVTHRSESSAPLGSSGVLPCGEADQHHECCAAAKGCA